MPLRLSLLVVLLVSGATLSAGASDAGADGYQALVQEARDGFLAQVPLDQILTKARVRGLKPQGADFLAVQKLDRIKAALPDILAVQKGAAQQSQRTKAFAVLDLVDAGLLYNGKDATALPGADRARLIEEAAALDAQSRRMVGPEQRARIQTRMNQISSALGNGWAPQDVNGAAGVRASVGRPSDLARVLDDYKNTPTGLPTTIVTHAVPGPEMPAGVIQAKAPEQKADSGGSVRLPKPTDYFGGKREQLLQAVYKDAERIMTDPNYKHGTYPIMYRFAPDRLKKSMIAWEILKDNRYGDEKKLSDHYGIPAMTAGEVADVDHFLAGTLLGAVPVLGTAACGIGTVLYDGVQSAADLAKSNTKGAHYNFKQMGSDAKGCLYGFTVLAPGG